MVDLSLTHVALPVSNLNDSITCYTTYARMQVVHRRTVPATGFEVAWLSDTTRPFVVVLSERRQVDSPLVPPAHLGVACASWEEVDRLCALARGEGRLINGPRDAGPPIGPCRGGRRQEKAGAGHGVGYILAGADSNVSPGLTLWTSA